LGRGFFPLFRGDPVAFREAEAGDEEKQAAAEACQE